MRIYRFGQRAGEGKEPPSLSLTKNAMRPMGPTWLTPTSAVGAYHHQVMWWTTNLLWHQFPSVGHSVQTCWSVQETYKANQEKGRQLKYIAILRIPGRRYKYTVCSCRAPEALSSASSQQLVLLLQGGKRSLGPVNDINLSSSDRQFFSVRHEVQTCRSVKNDEKKEEETMKIKENKQQKRGNKTNFQGQASTTTWKD